MYFRRLLQVVDLYTFNAIIFIHFNSTENLRKFRIFTICESTYSVRDYRKCIHGHRLYDMISSVNEILKKFPVRVTLFSRVAGSQYLRS